MGAAAPLGDCHAEFVPCHSVHFVVGEVVIRMITSFHISNSVRNRLHCRERSDCVGRCNTVKIVCSRREKGRAVSREERYEKSNFEEIWQRPVSRT